MISRCSKARERTVNRSEWSSVTTTDDTTAGYRSTPATSIDAMRTVFLVDTALLGALKHIVMLAVMRLVIEANAAAYRGPIPREARPGNLLALSLVVCYIYDLHK